MAKPDKTNAMRLLDQRRIPYGVLEYDSEIHSAEDVANALGVPAEDVYKTLVMLRDAPGSRPLLVMAPAAKEVDTRRLAKSLGVKSVRMAPQKDAERLTGLQVGGIGALALTQKAFDVYIDHQALGREHILVNGGRRGLNLRIAVGDLVKVTGCKPVEI